MKWLLRALLRASNNVHVRLHLVAWIDSTHNPRVALYTDTAAARRHFVTLTNDPDVDAATVTDVSVDLADLLKGL